MKQEIWTIIEKVRADIVNDQVNTYRDYSALTTMWSEKNSARVAANDFVDPLPIQGGYSSYHQGYLESRFEIMNETTIISVQ